jgi:hypothetical protein
MKTSVRTALVLLLLSPDVLSAHPNHGPGELDHWLIGLLFVGLSLALISSLRPRKPGPEKALPKRPQR